MYIASTSPPWSDRLHTPDLRLISLGYLHKHILVPTLLVRMVDFAELAVLLLYLTNRRTLDKTCSD